MFDSMLRSYVVVGLVVFGLRAVLSELGIAPWVVMLGLAAAIMVMHGVCHVGDAVNWMRTRIGIYATGRRAVWRVYCSLVH